jgi:LuxR family transcriptional regulator, quorum-sensing system regulator LasR
MHGEGLPCKPNSRESRGATEEDNGGPPVTLSPRQLEVLRWMAQGKTGWEVAVIMDCSEATVNYHLKQAFRKLDVTNKVQAVSRAMSLGFLY